VNGPDVHLGHPRDVPERLAHPRHDPLFELSCGLFGKGKRHDVARRDLGRARDGDEQRRDPTRDDLGLSAPCTGNELQMSLAVRDGRPLCIGELHRLCSPQVSVR
jgi:hypothetical protein